MKAALRNIAAKLTLERLLRVSAILTIVALAMMVWSMLQPTPLPVMLAMSVGQALGTLAFGIYLYVIVVDLRRGRRRRRESLQNIPIPTTTEDKPAS